MNHDVFISYSHTDKSYADAVCHYLEQEKIKCWYAPRDISPGEEWAETINNAISGSKIFILVLSENSNSSSQVLREINLAVSKKLNIITFKVTDVEINKKLEYYLGVCHWLDAITRPFEQHLEYLREAVLRILNIPYSESNDIEYKKVRKNKEKIHPIKKCIEKIQTKLGIHRYNKIVKVIKPIFFIIILFTALTCGIDLYRFVNKIDLDKWIQFQYMLQDNKYIDGMFLSVDGKVFAQPMEDGTINIWQTSDGVPVQSLKTPYVKEKIGVAFANNNKIAFIIHGMEVTVFDMLTAKQMDQINLAAAKEISDSDTVINYGCYEEPSNIIDFFIGNKANGQIHKIIKYNFTDKNIMMETAVDGNWILGYTADHKYMIMQNQDFQLSLLNNQNFSDEPITGEQVLQICNKNVKSSNSYFNSDGSYFLKYYPQYTDRISVINCEDGKEIYYLNLIEMQYAVFEADNNLLIWSKSKLERINIQSDERSTIMDQAFSDENFHLKNNEIIDLEYIPNTNYIIALLYEPDYDYTRIIALDMDKKEIVAKSNSFAKKSSCNIFLIKNMIFVSSNGEDGFSIVKFQYRINDKGEIEFIE